MDSSEFLSAWVFDITTNLSDWPENPVTGLTSLLFLTSCLFIFYYLTCLVSRPRLIGGGARLKPHLLANCPTLTQPYWPTLWATNTHICTLSRYFLQRDINITYNRDILTLPDGGEIGLDWGSRSSGGNPAISDNAPILFYLPGFGGTSATTNAKYAMETGLASGYRPVVLVYRGTGGLLLKTPHLFCATNVEDLKFVFSWLHRTFPQADIIALGISFGGMMLTRYLHQERERSVLKAAIVASCLWDVKISSLVLEQRFINRNLYIKILVNSMKQDTIERNMAVLAKNTSIDVDLVLKSIVISDLDKSLVCPMFGYRSTDDYYQAASNRDKLHHIVTTFICITSTDDPFVPYYSLPVKEFSANPHTLLVATSCGGHLGFVEGLFPTSKTWLNRLCQELLVALANYHQ